MKFPLVVIALAILVWAIFVFGYGTHSVPLPRAETQPHRWIITLYTGDRATRHWYSPQKIDPTPYGWWRFTAEGSEVTVTGNVVCEEEK